MMNVAAWPEALAVDDGGTGQLSIVVTNTSNVIDAYHVEVFGVDAEWVEANPQRFSLFPNENQTVGLILQLPVGYPASERPIAINVRSENDPNRFAMATVNLQINEATRTTIQVDPRLVTAGRSATYGVIVRNDGNAPVRAEAFAIDPEDEAAFELEPPQVVVVPGHSQTIQVKAWGGRSWFGQPRARNFTLGVDAERRVESTAMFIQRPRIPRWMLSLGGLLTAAAVFAAVLSYTFDRVVEEASVDDAVIDQALRSGEAGGAVVPSNPGSVSGTLTTTTNAALGAVTPAGLRGPAGRRLASDGNGNFSGPEKERSDHSAEVLWQTPAQSGAGSAPIGIAAVQVDLFVADDPDQPVASAATDDGGRFTLANLGEGTYKMRLEGAGYNAVWFVENGPGAASPFDASDIAVVLGQPTALGEIQIGGIPVTVEGSVGGDADGATIRLVRPGVIDPDVPALVAETTIGPDGSFVLPDVPSPGDYEMIIEKPGSATTRRQLTIAPGEDLGDINVQLSPAEGRVAGRVSGPPGPLGGVTITATDGSHTIETVSYTEGDVGGFMLRNLSTPGRYTVTASADGYVAESRSVVLAAGQTTAPSLTMSLVPASGRIEGSVLVEGSPSGDVVISLSGGDVERIARPISGSGADAGTYHFQEIPAPGTYTLTFTSEAAASQVRVVTIDAAGGRLTVQVPQVDLRVGNRTVRGFVDVPGGDRVEGATLVLTDGVDRRELLSATDPLGTFAFGDVPPGTYTLTASRAGATDTVQVVDVQSGVDPDPIHLQLAPQASISGTVHTGGGRCELVVRLFPFDTFDSVFEQETLLVADRYAFQAVSAPQGFLIAVYTPNANEPLATTSVSSEPSEAKDAADIDVSANPACRSGGS